VASHTGSRTGVTRVKVKVFLMNIEIIGKWFGDHTFLGQFIISFAASAALLIILWISKNIIKKYLPWLWRICGNIFTRFLLFFDDKYIKREATLIEYVEETKNYGVLIAHCIGHLALFLSLLILGVTSLIASGILSIDTKHIMLRFCFLTLGFLTLFFSFYFIFKIDAIITLLDKQFIKWKKNSHPEEKKR
jgi:hypothetical protein